MLIVNSAVMVAIWEAQGLTLQCCFLYGCDLRYASACFHTSTINPCACCTILDQVVWLFIQLVPVLVAVERTGEFFSTPSEACELGYVAGLGIFFGGGLLKKGHAACWTATGTCGLPDVYCDLRGLRVRISWSTPVNPSQDLVITNYCSLNLPGYAVLTIPLSKPTSCHSAFNEPWVQTSPIESCLVFLGWLRRKKQVVLEGTSATMQSAISSKGSYRRPEDWHHPGNINQELDGLALKTSQNSDHHRLSVWIYWQPNCVSHTHLDQWLWSFLDAAGEHLFCCQVAGASTDLKGLQWIEYWERVVEAPLNDR